MAKFDAERELRERIAQARRKKDGSVLFVLGSGVAKGASGGAGAADWSGLLDLGVSACDALKAKGALKSSALWDGVELRRRLESKSADDLIAVASAVEKALRASGAYEGFLRDSVGALPLKSREVCDALAELTLPVATCNYDGLLEKALLRPPISWRDHGMVLRFLKGQQDGILHLHGHYNEPESVVLGIESYSKIIGSEHAQAVQRLLFLDRTLVFVGFGAGLADPNFGALLRWATQVVPGTDCFHVRLGRDSDVGDLMAVHPLTQRIHVLGYGPEHKDLAPYLRSLLQKRTIKSTSLGTKDSEGISVRSESRITLAFVRQQLNQHLCSASDFDAFCLDYFSEVYARFTSGMDRVQRTNLLLSITDPKRVYEQLMAHCAGASTGDPAPPPPAPEPPPPTGGLRDARAPRSPEPPPPASRGTPPPRPQVNALLFLDRTAQYGRLLLGAARGRAQNRALLLYGGPEQNLEWFVRRVEEFLQDDHVTGCKVVNVPLRLNNVYAGTAADWGLHLKHALETHIDESSLPLPELIAQASERSPLFLSLVAEDNPLAVLGTLSARQRAGLKDFVTTALPKLLSDSRRTGITVLLPLEVRHSDGVADLRTEAQGWLQQAWHSDERTHDVLPEVRFPSWDDVASYLRSHHPPLNDLNEVLKEAEKEYAKFGQESTFEQLAKALNNIVARHS
ncbi:MAG: SIR2 family protein [Myxococcales bacterium]|nr:SIR2 family protein [Myxococcales bacterium]